ncbi:methyltransferase [Pseudotenacibaculum sp. MALMAid0570]|uniref:methyltransferase n=1 Tax=Pseudotenacibaculum sp. MALMAid0570 TaxID=3143938 RepID=UPI0032DFD40A
MFKLIYGNWMQQCTYTFAELAFADVLQKAPKTHTELTEELNLDGIYLKQFLRCITELGFVNFNTSTKAYELTEFGALLSSNHPYSKRAEARLNGAEYRYMPWGHLTSILKNGNGPKYSPTIETGTLDYLQDKPELLEVFHEAMFKIWKTEDDKIVEAFDFSPFKKVMDIGGGKGSFLMKMLEKNNQLEGVVFDLDTTFEDTVLGKDNMISGDFFKEVPDVADLYTMKNVIHNWPEDRTKNILTNVRKAMDSSDGIDTPKDQKRLLIIENILPDDGSGDISNWMSLNFMILVNGQERNKEEYRILGKECGFHLEKIYSTETNREIIEYSLL